MLLLSGVAFEEFGYRSDLGSESMPMLTYRVLTHIPDLVTVGGLLLGGIWWIRNRSSEVATAERVEKMKSKKQE